MSNRKLVFLLFFSLFFTKNLLLAQCPITVSAGPDVLVCDPGNSAYLNGSISGPFLGFVWSPPTGLNNPNVLNPFATVTGPMTYTLSAQAVDPSATNLVNNPGFEAGNTGFTSVYTYNPLPITPGTYVMTTSPALVLSTFPPCDDHTYGNGTGNMMLINGNAVTGSQVWCQTINVSPNTWYVMSAWAMASPLFPPTLQFSVNGVGVGDPYPVGTGTCNWQQFSASWYSGSATTAQLCIVDQISGGNGFLGDDYALDDVFFAAACTVTDEVNVGVANIQAVVPTTAILPCNAVQSGIQLNGSASSSGPGITYLWTGPGVIGGATTPIATVNQVGNYTLTVYFTSGATNCQVSQSVMVQDDPNIVTATATANNPITCANPTVSLDGTGTSTGGTISYAWEPSFAVISGQGTLMPTVNQSGQYTLTVTNSISGCTATATATVLQNTTLPNAAAAAPVPLSCANTEVTLSGNNSSIGSEFSYQWVGPGIVSGDDLLNNCIVNIPGQYTLTVTNNVNGCTATATANVIQDGSAPTAVANANAPGSLDCDTPTLTLNSTGSSTGTGITYTWTTTNGNFTSPTNGSTATVDEGGTYFLTVTNALGCTAIASVSVTADFAQPTVGIATPIPTFLCDTDSVMLDASQSTSGMGFGLVWASQNGTFLSGSTTLMPWVGSAGTYTITITNNTNGCTASASATVAANTTPPIAQAGPNATLDCDGTAINLNGNGSSTGPNITYLWTTNGGNIVSGDTTLTPEVDGTGTYFILVENTTNNCTALDSIQVGQDANAPIVQIDPPGQLDCNTDELMLDASGSSAGANIALIWTGPGLVSGQDTYTPIVNQPGTYVLTLSDLTNNCVANASVVVVENTVAPVADAGAAPVLDCSAQSGMLDGSGSSQGPAFSYLWSNGATILTPTITAAGTYTLTVTNASNGCTATDNVTVAAFGNLPDVDIATPGNLDCSQPAIQLSATASTGPEFTYNWTFTGTGTGIVSGGTTLTPTVGSPGSYTLTVTNTLTSCTASETVQVMQSASLPTANAGLPQSLLCGTASLTLNGSGSSSGPDITYLWTTTNGNILNGDSTTTPEVNAPGTYTLTVLNTINGCSDSDDVLIGQDANAPIAVAGAPQSLTCTVLSVMLNGTGSSTGTGISYLWTTTDGSISAGAMTLTPTVTAAGTYLLTVSDATNNCQTLASVQVIDQSQQPDAIVAAPQSLGCNVATVTLDGLASSTGADFAYQWTGPGIVSGATTLMPVVNAPGVYAFTVTNTTTNCVTVAQVTVVGDSTPPLAIAAAPQSLNCILQQVLLSGTDSSTGTNFAYLWTGPGIVSGGTSLAPTVNLPGLYTLTVTNLTNNCTATATANVLQTATPPTAIAAAPQNLTCIAQQVTLSGAGSSAGLGIVYLWLGPGIVSGATTLSPVVNMAGTYTLTVTNATNLCTATATVNVGSDTTPPTAIAAAPQSLDCIAQQVTLSGTGSSTGAGFAYLWSGPGILSGGTTLSPVVNAPGTYTLTVTNQTNGCMAMVSTTVLQTATPPTAIAAAPQNLTCIAQQTTLDGTGSSTGAGIGYLWTGPGIVGSPTAITTTANLPGTYTLTVANVTNGCTATAQVTVVLDIVPPTVEAGPSFSLGCNQDTVTLQGSSNVANASFAWSSATGNFVAGQLAATPAVDSPGTYTLTVTNPDNGCTATDFTVVTVVTPVFPTPEIVVPTCANPLGSISFSGVAGLFFYSIEGGTNPNTTGNFENLVAGEYEVVVFDAFGCEANFSISLPSASSLVVTLPAVASIEAGGLLQLNPVLSIPQDQVASIGWSPAAGLSCTDCLNPTASPTGDAIFTVTVTSVDGCTASASIAVSVSASVPGEVFVPNAFSPNNDGINDVLVVFADEAVVKNVVSLRVFTRWGESVFEGFSLRPNDVGTGWDGSFRGKKVDVGVYVWFAELELATGERKLLKGDVVVVR